MPSARATGQQGAAWPPRAAPMQMPYRPMMRPIGMPMGMQMAMPMSMGAGMAHMGGMPAQIYQPQPQPSSQGDQGTQHTDTRARYAEGVDTRYDPEMASALNELAQGLAELEAEDRTAETQAGAQVVEPEGPLIDSNGTEWAGHFREQSSNMREDAASIARGGNVGYAGIPIDDTPADLAHVLNVLPPGVARPERSRHNQYGDQDALIMADNTASASASASRGRSVRFTPGQDVRPMGSGVPSSLAEALGQATTAIPGSSAQWEDTAFDDDLAAFDEEAFMNFNGAHRVAREQRIGVGAMEGWGEMQNDWDEFQRGLPKSAL